MDLLLLTLLGGLLALDGTSVGQFMVSRPLVVGVLAGWVMGDPALGLLLGGLLELFLIPALPVGGSEFPEGTPPAIVAVATASSGAAPGALALGALFGLLWARLGALSISVLRKANGRMVPDPSRDGVSRSAMVKGHLAGIFLDFLRGVLLTGTGLLLGPWLSRVLSPAWPLNWQVTAGLLALGATLPAGALLSGLGGWRKRGVVFGSGFLGFLLASLVL